MQVLRVLYEADIAEPLILWALADAAQKLLTLKNGGEVRTGRRQLERLQKVARTAPTKKIHKLLSRAAKTDQVIKGLIVGDAKIALLGLTADLATVGRNVKIRPSRSRFKTQMTMATAAFTHPFIPWPKPPSPLPALYHWLLRRKEMTASTLSLTS